MTCIEGRYPHVACRFGLATWCSTIKCGLLGSSRITSQDSLTYRIFLDGMWSTTMVVFNYVVVFYCSKIKQGFSFEAPLLSSTLGLRCFMWSNILQVMLNDLLLFCILRLHTLVTSHITVHADSKRVLTLTSSALMPEISLLVLSANMHGTLLVVKLLLLILIRENWRVLAWPVIVVHSFLKKFIYLFFTTLFLK